MAQVLLGLGANLGDPAGQLAEALDRIGSVGEIRAVSSLYRTDPVGPVAQPEFLNAVCLIETPLSAERLLDATQAIERALGRTRGVDKGPRRIDLDLLDYAGMICSSPRLVLPHPELHRRGFVLVPLAEICPEWRHPLLDRTARALLDEVGSAGVCPVTPGDAVAG